MTNTISVGTMLLADGTNTPGELTVATVPYTAGWSSVTGLTSTQLDKEVERAGWTFFYMAGEIRTHGYGLTERSRMDKAVAQVISRVALQKCNCLEITQISQRSFWGLSYTVVVAHARHIQESLSFHELSNVPANRRSRPNQWLYNKTTAGN